MKSVTKIKDEARKHEQREEWDRAVQLYLQVLRTSDDEALSESELPLYNRVGDLHVRMGQPAEAVKYYEQAADRYAEAGLFNNAIALCNKALRYQPARLSLFRKLGQFCAQQGFLTDARRWYLEFAERMFKHGEDDEAFSALEDFASVSDDPEVRVHLARKLHAHERRTDALGEFRHAYATWQRSGDAAAADAVRREVLELYPEGPDLGEEETSDRWPATRGPHEPASDLPTFGDAAEAVASPAVEPAAADEVADVPVEEAARDDLEAPAETRLDGFEGTQLADAADTDADIGSGMLAGLDTGRDDTLERMQREEAEAPNAGLPLLDQSADETDLAPPEAEEQPEPNAGLPLLDETTDETGLAPPEADEQPEPNAGLPLLDDDAPPAEPEPAEPAPALDVGPLDVRLEDDAPARDETPPPAQEQSPPATPAGQADEYVDLYALLAPDEDRVETTRFFIQESEPTGDEDHDFAELLNQFRRKLAEHVPENDAGSHYDLGLAFKEMGLIDDAISEFQIALRAGQDRLKVFEELGQCFILKNQHNIAVKVLSRALQFEHRDEIELIGVYYFLGRAYEALGQLPSARDAYERVMGLDIRFEDVQERVNRL